MCQDCAFKEFGGGNNQPSMHARMHTFMIVPPPNVECSTRGWKEERSFLLEGALLPPTDRLYFFAVPCALCGMCPIRHKCWVPVRGADVPEFGKLTLCTRCVNATSNQNISFGSSFQLPNRWANVHPNVEAQLLAEFEKAAVLFPVNPERRRRIYSCSGSCHGDIGGDVFACSICLDFYLCKPCLIHEFWGPHKNHARVHDFVLRNPITRGRAERGVNGEPPQSWMSAWRSMRVPDKREPRESLISSWRLYYVGIRDEDRFNYVEAVSDC
ncbi:hypothetical protein SAICODRAFT_29943 [Saitoella complicata NRRL Y-17804]|nr:uncharacterized protein SAICODRAFT_29943 [Saitoella complicata NRRL Y-17804]ODQ53544.1 hypothetical protein SAICODRAFT_29943 [Saitoella complicata NRRL Y-17804]